MSEWQEIDGKTDETWNQKEVLIGKYISVEDNVGPNNSLMYHIKKDDGSVVGVWGSTVLDMKISKAKIGDYLRLESLGMKKNPKTGREFKDYSVKSKTVSPVEEIFPGAEL